MHRFSVDGLCGAFLFLTLEVLESRIAFRRRVEAFAVRRDAMFAALLVGEQAIAVVTSALPTTFTKTSGSGTSKADFDKGTVKKGDSVEVTVTWDGSDPRVERPSS